MRVGWATNNWCSRTVVLEKAFEESLDSKEIKQVSPKGNQFWIFIGRTDAEAETPIFWPPDVKSQLIGKGPDAGKDWGQQEKRATEDEMMGWNHQLNGHDTEGQGRLVCCSPWGWKESDTTEWTTIISFMNLSIQNFPNIMGLYKKESEKFTGLYLKKLLLKCGHYLILAQDMSIKGNWKRRWGLKPMLNLFKNWLF